MIIRGNASAVNIDGAKAQELYNAGFKWSGHTHPGTGVNVKFASEGDMYILEHANSIGGTIMEQTPGGQVFDNWRGLGGMYPEWDTPTNLAQKPIWDALSSQYANGAEGIATYVHPNGYVGKVWSNIEKPILEENDIIIQEVIIDAK